MSGTLFFQITKNYKLSLYPFLTFFSTSVLETHLGGLKAACIGPAISKGEQGTAELGANTVLKQTIELCL